MHACSLLHCCTGGCLGTEYYKICENDSTELDEPYRQDKNGIEWMHESGLGASDLSNIIIKVYIST